MECKHPQEALMGTAEGIICRSCGKTFKDFNEVLAARGEQPVEETPKKRARKKGEDK